MKRALGALSERSFDLVIVGGGIYGAWAAWDASLRGLSVALIERADFGGATSANSLKIIHGGFRYVPNGDLARMRQSIRERRVLMSVAPHLAHLLRFLLPTYARGRERRGLLRAGLALYDLLSADRNRAVADPSKRIPASRLVSRQECLRLAPGLPTEGLTGGALWHDGQLYNPERLTLSIVRSAVETGACAANYVEATGLRCEGSRLTGVDVLDRLEGRRLTVRGRVIVNAAGPWVNRIAGLWRGQNVPAPVRFSKALNVVTRPMTNGQAISVALPHRGRPGGPHEGCCHRLHIAPWRGRAIAGSLYRLSEGVGEEPSVTEEEVARLVEDLNAAYPGARLRPEEVSFVHVGEVPRQDVGLRADPNRLTSRFRVIDHAAIGGPQGLLSVIGVKYTTARDVAEKTVTLALRKLGLPARPSRSGRTRVFGGSIDRFDEFLASAIRQHRGELDEEVVRQLVLNYGSGYREVLALGAQRPQGLQRVGGSTTLRAQVSYAIREEMAQTLEDVVLRRTELGTLGHPGHTSVFSCATQIAQELGWDDQRFGRELSGVEAAFARHRARPGMAAPSALAAGAARIGVPL
jgi:glycerol-3-phosphate dehydrogenase